MKVFLLGKDNVNWSIDSDRKYTKIFLKELGIKITNNFILADVTHAVWWNYLFSPRFYPLRWKKIIAVVTNDLDIKSSEFLKAKKIVDLWIAPSKMMLEKLIETNVKVKYQPFYVDENKFYKINKEKETLAQELGIDYNIFKNKLIIGSFQRDSLGLNLNKPKWQKGPEILIDILKEFLKYNEDFILLLAGPRRHWIIKKCREIGIPYYFFGEDPKERDDIRFNIVNKENMNRLYNLADLYIISSRKEGGPKAVLECSFAKTMVLSTYVGLAPDFLHPWCLYKDPQEAVQKIMNLNQDKISKFVDYNFKNAYSNASYKATLKRWKSIYEEFSP